MLVCVVFGYVAGCAGERILKEEEGYNGSALSSTSVVGSFEQLYLNTQAQSVCSGFLFQK